MALASLFGPNLVKKENKEAVTCPTSEMTGKGKVIGIYFSAHWCPPCKTFTPLLSTFWYKFKKTEHGANFEIVFVSSDRDQKSFDEYYASMPWFSLPFAERDLKAKLSAKFKVSGIPSLIFVDGETGEIINKNGREIVTTDKNGEDFPWKPKSFPEIMAENDGKLVDKEGTEFNFEEVTQGKNIGLYFSAHWCPPCRGFTPELVKTFNTLKEAGKPFEIIFCSGDRDEASFKEYLDTMPWKALPLHDSREKKLSSLFEVEGIPQLTILDEKHELITSNGRAAVSQDPNGDNFPWHPQPMEELAEPNASTINEFPAVIIFTDGSEAKIQHAKNILEEHAQREHQKGSANKELFFFWGSEDDICSSIRDFCNLSDEPEDLLVLLNIPGQSIHVCKEPVETLTSDSIGSMLAKFADVTLEQRSLR